MVALNPFKEIYNIYCNEVMDRYHKKSNELPAHIYNVASEALRAMKNISQSIMILGESGAGKTESTKHIIKFLCSLEQKHLVDKLGNATSILDAFGNRETSKNYNSSRYCKFFEVNFIGFLLHSFDFIDFYT